MNETVVHSHTPSLVREGALQPAREGHCVFFHNRGRKGGGFSPPPPTPTPKAVKFAHRKSLSSWVTAVRGGGGQICPPKVAAAAGGLCALPPVEEHTAEL